MDFRIRPAFKEDKVILKHLMQYYFYDFSEFMDVHVNENGCFGDYPTLEDYWKKETHIPYLIEKDGRHAGFVLVTESEVKRHFKIAEFFIMKRYRKSGLGKAVAHQLFDRHRGEWEVLQIEKNVPAQAFWRKVIGEYTDGAYTEHTTEKGSIIQIFSHSLIK